MCQGALVTDLRRFACPLLLKILRPNEAFKDAAALAASTWKSQSEVDCIWDDRFPNEGYVDLTEIDDVLTEFAWEDYAAVEPFDAGLGVEANAERGKRMMDWLRSNTRPWVFGTKTKTWAGIPSDEVIKQVDEMRQGRSRLSPTQRADRIVDDLTDLEEFTGEYENEPSRRIVDYEEAFGLVRTYFENSSDPMMRAEAQMSLEDGLMAWNAKQTISVLWFDRKVTVPLFEGVTKDEAMAWMAAETVRLAADVQRLSTVVESAPSAVALAT